jgi:A/G-specific adenine glycosylase
MHEFSKFPFKNEYFSEILFKWYELNKRDLPWRDITDPYKIWISEIILQQTRVNQGLNYYLRFINRFPTVEILANASEDEVLKYWQGLGYYSRARNLHKAAQQIRSDFQGVFPSDFIKILQLSGIGEYTAAAIASFAYNQFHAVVDGNVYRVISRLFAVDTPIDSGIGKKEFAFLAEQLLPESNPGIYNQAIMEFGALQCVPVSPDCGVCPLQPYCKAYALNLVDVLPIKKSKTKVKNRYFNYLCVDFEDKTFLQKREAKDIWQNLYEFPLIESEKLLSTEELIKNENFCQLFKGIPDVEFIQKTNPIKHVLSHQVLFAQFFRIRITEINELFNKLTLATWQDIDQFAVSRLMELYLEKLKK